MINYVSKVLIDAMNLVCCDYFNLEAYTWKFLKFLSE